MKISLCMIVWNEQDTIEGALESAIGLADEIVIVDTGSTDRTVDLMRQRTGVRVITGADRMHKANARNLAQSHATGDWTIILDADERIADPVGLRRFLKTTDAQAIYIKLSFMDGDIPTLTYSQMRCWRRGTFEYKYRAHEIPLPTNEWGKQVYTEFIWEHRPPQDRLWKSEYTRDRLLLDVKENPGDSRPLYYLGRQYMYRGEWQESVERLRQYLDNPGHDEADAWYCLSKCYRELDEEKQRIKALHQACAVNPSRREWWGDLAVIYHQKGQDEIATGLLKCALEQPAPSRDYVNAYWYGSAIYDLLARCLYKLGRYEEGQKHAQKALELNPDDERLKKNLLWFDFHLGSMDAFYTLHGPNTHSNRPRHKAIAQLVKGPRVLDVGCGTGDLLLLLQERDSISELVGTDISQVALDMAAQRRVKAELYCRSTLPVGLFNTIVISQVIEHLSDDRAMIEESARKLSDGGQLIVSVPRDGRVPSPDHKREYSKQSLEELLSIVGDPVLHSWPGERDRLLMSVVKND